MHPFARKSRRCLCGAVLLGLVLGPLAAFAQSSGDKELTSLSIEELARVKVFSASRHTQDSLVAPSAVTVITAKEIAQYGWRTLGDVLNSVRGFYTSDDRRNMYLGVRGFQRPGDYNERILLLVDGHRLNENIFGGALIGTNFPLDLDLIDRVEVVRGPSSSLYGNNALFGVINVITRKPSTPLTLEASGESSSFVGRSGRVTAGGERHGVAALFSGSMYRSNGESSIYFPEFNSPLTNNGYATNLDGDSYAHAFGEVTYGNLRVQGLWGSRKKVDPGAAYLANFDGPGTTRTDTRAYIDASYRRSLSANTELEVRGYYDNYQYFGSFALGGADPSQQYTGIVTSVADWVGTQATLGWQIGKHRITTGAEVEHSFRVDQKGYAIGGPVGGVHADDHRTPSLAAGFAEAELKLARTLTLNVGGRLDWFDAFGSSFSPRVAVIYSPNSRTALKYIFGRAFRAPNAFEAYYGDGVRTAVNPNLKPETMLAHDVVLEYHLKPWLEITGDGFYYSLDNLIEQQFDPSVNLLRYVNDERAVGKGLEFEIAAKRSSGAMARASYTLADVTDEQTHARLASSPLHTAKLHASMPIPRWGSAGGEFLFANAQQDHQGFRIPSSFLANLTYLSRQLWGGWTLSASCYNLFDRRWFAPTGPEHVQAEIPQPGRGYRFKLTYRVQSRERGEKK